MMDGHSHGSMDEAMQLAEAGHLQKAQAAFQQVVQEQPSNAAAHEMLAQVLMELDQPADALQAAENAVALKPQWADAHITLARAQRNAGLLPESLTSYHAAKVRLGEDSVLCSEVASELEEVAQLYSKQVAQQVGLPLNISTAPGSGVGPGCVVWDCGLLLATYLTQHMPAGALRHQAMLELGAGTGLVGLTAAALGAQAMLTDDIELMPLLQQNIAHNRKLIDAAGGSVQCAPFMWHLLKMNSHSEQADECTALSQPAWQHVQNADTVAQFLGQGVRQCGCCWLLGSDLLHAEKQVPQLQQALLWVLQQVRAAAKAATASHALGAGDSSNTPPVRFLLTHKHRSQTVDRQLLLMLQLTGFTFIRDERTLCDMKQLVATSGCHTHEHEHAQCHGLSQQQQQQQQQHDEDWTHYRLAEYRNCGLYCLAHTGDAT